MAERMPPLHALRAFECASRMLSFTRAAQELNVTPAAISQQIKTLEGRLGIRLFKRDNNKLALTERGATYMPAVREALDMISAATHRVCDGSQRNVLNLSLLPVFAIQWLFPRMSTFNDAHPDIDLRLSTTYRTVDFRTEDIDAAIRYGEGTWDGLVSEFLFAEGVMPVCSPRLIERRDMPLHPDDLAGYTLLHSANTPDYWRLWLGTAGASKVDPSLGKPFDNCLMALEAAANGLGFALANPAYLERDISAKRLVAPFSEELTRNTGWYFVYPIKSEDLDKIARFREWLFRELAHKIAAADAAE